MKISLIVAAAENRVIGRDDRLPWHLPADLKRFKRLTLGHAVIMGRKTHESIVERLGRPLPKRRSLVLSRNPAFPRRQHGRPAGVETASSLEQALALAAEAGESEVFVAGGASVFAEALPSADRLYLTRVHAEVEGDVLFPEVDLAGWQRVEQERHEGDERHAFAFTFETWDQRRRD